MRLSLKSFVSRNSRAYVYFERMGLARRIFRRCIELSDSLSAQGEKVGAGREKAAQIRCGESPATREKLLLCRLADRSRRFTVRKEHSHGFPCGLRSRSSEASLRYCFLKRIMAEPAGLRDVGRTPRRHRLRVFCATPSRKRQPEPVIGAVLHCMSELTG